MLRSELYLRMRRIGVPDAVIYDECFVKVLLDDLTGLSDEQFGTWILSGPVFRRLIDIAAGSLETSATQIMEIAGHDHANLSKWSNGKMPTQVMIEDVGRAVEQLWLKIAS